MLFFLWFLHYVVLTVLALNEFYNLQILIRKCTNKINKVSGTFR